MKIGDVVFDPSDLSGNAAKLVELFGLASEADVPLVNFLVSDGAHCFEAEVKEGKYKTALLLLFFSELYIEGRGSGWPEGSRSFPMNARFREIMRGYFAPEICDDAVKNPDTKHGSVKALLQDGARVTLEFGMDPN